ncbi:hypothetical protein [Streptomyces sp. NPDC002685]|uniref:ATP-dependent DNA ligase n=1 Tax=Streptomyces sp. NPDC002685 TaxID=3154540 RepID=UPI00331ACAAE
MVAHISGELVIWHDGRLAFERLLRRPNRRPASVAAEVNSTPAHYVAFDLLRVDVGDGDVARLPYRDRRARLEKLFADQGLMPPWTLCPMTLDRDEALSWMREWAPAGIEGIVSHRMNFWGHPAGPSTVAWDYEGMPWEMVRPADGLPAARRSVRCGVSGKELNFTVHSVTGTARRQVRLQALAWGGLGTLVAGVVVLFSSAIVVGVVLSHLPHALAPWHLRPPPGCTPFSLAPATEEERPVKRTQHGKWAANLRGGEGRWQAT